MKTNVNPDKRTDELIYLDNAASSWPKPECVTEAMVEFHQRVGANPGRSGHRMSQEAGRILYLLREKLAQLLNVQDPLRIVLCSNATEALNLALKGLLRPGDHVVTTQAEHNSVMRPLRELQKSGVEISVADCDSKGYPQLEKIKSAVRENTKLVVMYHGSNVTGSVAPIREAGRLARERDLLFLVDAAQTAGCYPIDFENDCIDLLAFTGHKSLLGPQGTGGLVIGERVPVDELKPLKSGGTGSNSEREEQPEFLPDKYESGTANAVGAAGLLEGVRYLLSEGVDRIRRHELSLASLLLAELKNMGSVIVYGPSEEEERIAVISFRIEGADPGEVSFLLDKEFSVMTRAGLHCAPGAHRAISTFPTGTVRLSPGYFNTEEQVEKTVRAIHDISRRT